MALAPWIAPAVLATYVHNIGIRLRREFRGHTRHPGDAAAIVRACIEACWNGRTFTASPGHFDMFWTRDLSFSVPVAGPPRARRARHALAGLRARRLGAAAQPHHDDDPLLRSPRRRLRIRRRLAAAVPGRPARRRCDRPRRAPPAVARGRDRPLLRDGRRPGDRPRPFRSQVQRPSRHGRQSLERVRQHDGRAAGQDDRGDRLVRLAVRAPFRGRLRPPADRSFLGRTTISATRSATRPSRARPTSGRSTRGSSATRASSRPPCATSMPTASATRIRCATRRAGGPSARSG